jgi:hypothetical protein
MEALTDQSAANQSIAFGAEGDAFAAVHESAWPYPEVRFDAEIVRLSGQSGRHLLGPSPTESDPTRTPSIAAFALNQCRRGVETSRFRPR